MVRLIFLCNCTFSEKQQLAIYRQKQRDKDRKQKERARKKAMEEERQRYQLQRQQRAKQRQQREEQKQREAQHILDTAAREAEEAKKKKKQQQIYEKQQRQQQQVHHQQVLEDTEWKPTNNIAASISPITQKKRAIKVNNKVIGYYQRFGKGENVNIYQRPLTQQQQLNNPPPPLQEPTSTPLTPQPPERQATGYSLTSNTSLPPTPEQDNNNNISILSSDNNVPTLPAESTSITSNTQQKQISTEQQQQQQQQQTAISHDILNLVPSPSPQSDIASTSIQSAIASQPTQSSAYKQPIRTTIFDNVKNPDDVSDADLQRVLQAANKETNLSISMNVSGEDNETERNTESSAINTDNDNDVHIDNKNNDDDIEQQQPKSLIPFVTIMKNLYANDGNDVTRTKKEAAIRLYKDILTTTCKLTPMTFSYKPQTEFQYILYTAFPFISPVTINKIISLVTDDWCKLYENNQTLDPNGTAGEDWLDCMNVWLPHMFSYIFRFCYTILLYP